jgi:hypothetical protein
MQSCSATQTTWSLRNESRPNRQEKVIRPLCEALDHLNVPYTIDLMDWHQCSAAFREVAGPQRVGGV